MSNDNPYESSADTIPRPRDLRPFKYALVALLVIAIAAITLIPIVQLYINKFKPTIGYGIRAEFRSLPADDAALIAWMKEQPGVINCYVNRDSDTIIVVYWNMSQNVAGPPTPELRDVFDTFGYKRLVSFDPHWRD